MTQLHSGYLHQTVVLALTLPPVTPTALFRNLYPPVRSAASAPVSSSSVSKRRAPTSVTPHSWERHNVAAMSNITIDPELKPGEFVIKSLFAEFAVLAEKKIEMVMAEPLVSLVCMCVCVCQGGRVKASLQKKTKKNHRK